MTDKRPPADQGWNAPGTCGGGYWRVVNGIYESWPPNPRNTVTMGAGLTMGAVAPSSPVETTDAPARPLPPEALNGLTGAAYTDVIRREADEDIVGRLGAVIYEQVEAIAERDATIERLWAQLNEATNVPDHNDPEFGFDKTAALSEPTPWCGCHICTRHGQIKSKP